SQGAVLSTSGKGGGTVLIRGGRLGMDHSSIVADTLGAVDGGGIDVRVTGDLVENGGSTIRAVTQDDGRAGDIRLEARRLILTGAGIGSGSGIEVQPSDGANETGSGASSSSSSGGPSTSSSGSEASSSSSSGSSSTSSSSSGGTSSTSGGPI